MACSTAPVERPAQLVQATVVVQVKTNREGHHSKCCTLHCFALSSYVATNKTNSQFWISKAKLSDAHPGGALNPKPQTLNPAPETLSPKPETRMCPRLDLPSGVPHNSRGAPYEPRQIG